MGHFGVGLRKFGWLCRYNEIKMMVDTLVLSFGNGLVESWK